MVYNFFYPEKYGDLGVVGANLLLLLGETLLFYLICTFFYVKSRKEWVYFLVLILGSGLRKAFPWLPAGVWPFLMACLVSCLIGIGFLRLLKRNYAKTVRISAWNAGICLVLGLILRLALGGE